MNKIFITMALPLAIIVGLTGAKICSVRETEAKAKNIEKIEAGLQSLSDDGVYNTYGDGMDKELLLDCSFSVYKDIMPKTYDTFKAAGGKIIVCDDENFADVANTYGHSSNSNTKGTVEGTFNKKYINICLRYNPNTCGATELHELAHFADCLYHFSDSREFKDLYTKYASTYISQSTTADYAISGGIKEYFAILASDMTTSCDISLLNLPEEVYDYMRNVFMILEDKEI